MRRLPSPPGALSVCVPAFDEERSIRRVVAEIGREDRSVVGEILVCTNGCTDATEHEARRAARSDRRVRLLSSPPGKARAWTALLAAARSERVAFCDADNWLQPGAFAALGDALEAAPAALVAAGVELPRPVSGVRATLWGLGGYSFGHDYLSGRLYALRRSALEARLRDHGFRSRAGRAALPEDLIHEDLFLEMLLGPGELVVAPGAVVRFDPGGLANLVRYRSRIQLARAQLSRRWPELFEPFLRRRGTFAPGRLPGRIVSLWRAGTLAPALAGLAVRFVARQARPLSAAVDEMGREERFSGGEAVLRGAGRQRRAPGGPA